MPPVLRSVCSTDCIRSFISASCVVRAGESAALSAVASARSSAVAARVQYEFEAVVTARKLYRGSDICGWWAYVLGAYEAIPPFARGRDAKGGEPEVGDTLRVCALRNSGSTLSYRVTERGVHELKPQQQIYAPQARRTKLAVSLFVTSRMQIFGASTSRAPRSAIGVSDPSPPTRRI